MRGGAAPTTVMIALAGLALATREARADQTIELSGTVEAGGLDHVFLDFEVPEGVREIQIDHAEVDPDADILDWGLEDPSGFRGWGGGNDEPIVVGEQAASRSYLTGAIAAGTWRLVIGKARIGDDGAGYHVTVTLRDAPTLAPQPERAPFEDRGPVASDGPRWYAGDLHVHSRESGDARPPIDEIVAYAKSRRLDFVELSDHNTTSQLDFMADAQARAGALLLVPGVEFTTYDGHANGIGATAFVDHKIGQPGVTIDAAVDAFHEMGALFSLNHPMLDVGEACIGCAWKHDLAAEKIDAIEIATAGSASLFIEPTLALWESLSDSGRHIAAVGGSDDHTAGQDVGAFGAPIGSPTTMVHADELSTRGILEGIRAGHTVVKVRGPDDPMVELSRSDGGSFGLSVVARITGGAGLKARWVENGVNGELIDIEEDDAELELPVLPPAPGVERRYRLEIWEGKTPVTFTSHLFITASDAGASPAGGPSCSAAKTTSATGSEAGVVAIFGAMGAIAIRVLRSKGCSR